MGKKYHSNKCECGNEIEIYEYHNAGGVNDNHVVVYQCNKCFKKGYAIAENFDQSSIKGASVVSYADTESLNIDDYLKKHGLK
jgi:hypothetical protein